MPSVGFLKDRAIFLAGSNERDNFRESQKLGRSNPPRGKRSRVSHDDSIANDVDKYARSLHQ